MSIEFIKFFELVIGEINFSIGLKEYYLKD